MGLMDAFNPEATTELKVGELYEMLQQAAENAQTAKFLLNGVKNEVPYKYIREIVTGEKEPDENEDPVVMNANIEIHASELARVIKKTVLENAAGGKGEEPEEDEEAAAGDEDFDPLPFPEVCKTKEENDRYHELAQQTKTDLEHIAHDLGINNACYLSKEKTLDLIIEYERKAAGEDKGGDK